MAYREGSEHMQRAAMHIAAVIIGVVGALDGIVVNTIVSASNRVAQFLGSTADATHGFIGLLVCLVALAAALLAVKLPAVGGIVLILAGIAFFFVVGWWALLASPQMLVAGVLGVLDQLGAGRMLARREEPAATA